MDHVTTDVEDQLTRRRRGVKVAIAGLVAAGVLATSGVAHAGYRWGKMAVVSTTTTTTAPRSTTTAKPTVTTATTTTTVGADTPMTAAGYRWG